uniref:Uncharacterized protein n=1 Tax=Eutreptiella gymnastica TaxID=73025 RepID=A0A7S4D0K0_9EUGL
MLARFDGGMQQSFIFLWCAGGFGGLALRARTELDASQSQSHFRGDHSFLCIATPLRMLAFANPHALPCNTLRSPPHPFSDAHYKYICWSLLAASPPSSGRGMLCDSR